MKHFIYILIFVGIIIALWAMATSAEESLLGLVNTHRDPLNIRSGPGLNYPIIGKIAKGRTVMIKGDLEEWYHIQLPQGMVGYVHREYIRPISPSTQPEGAVLESNAIGIVIHPGSTIYAEESDKVLETPMVYAAFLMLDDQGKIILPSGRIGRIDPEDLHIMDIHWLSGHLKSSDKEIKHPFIVQGYRTVRDENTLLQFYNVRFINQDQSAGDQSTWIRREEIHLFHHHALLHRAQKLLAFWEEHEWNPNDEELWKQAEQLYKHILRYYPNALYYPVYDENTTVDTAKMAPEPVGILALNTLADISIRLEKYSAAVQYLEEIAQRFSGIPADLTGLPGEGILGGIADGLAKHKIAGIYAAYLDEPDRAIRLLRDIIVTYPQQEITGIVWNPTLDILAFDEIIRIGNTYHRTNAQMMEHIQQIIDQAGSDVVKMMAFIKKSQLLREEQQITRAAETLVEAIKQHPTTSMAFYDTQVDFSVSALDLLCQIYIYDLGSPETAEELCQKLYEQYAGSRQNTLAEAALFLRAEIIDIVMGPGEEVLKAYDLFLNEVDTSWGVWSIVRGESIGEWVAKERLRKIRFQVLWTS